MLVVVVVVCLFPIFFSVWVNGYSTKIRVHINTISCHFAFTNAIEIIRILFCVFLCVSMSMCVCALPVTSCHLFYCHCCFGHFSIFQFSFWYLSRKKRDSHSDRPMKKSQSEFFCLCSVYNCWLLTIPKLINICSNIFHSLFKRFVYTKLAHSIVVWSDIHVRCFVSLFSTVFAFIILLLCGAGEIVKKSYSQCDWSSWPFSLNGNSFFAHSAGNTFHNALIHNTIMHRRAGCIVCAGTSTLSCFRSVASVNVFGSNRDNGSCLAVASRKKN